MPGDGPRIVIVGAGGWVFPLELIRDLFAFPGLHGSTLVLYDIDVAAAKRTLDAASELQEIGRVPASIVVAEELREALRGADVVLTVFQVGGVDAYAFDVEIPREYGVDQTVGDTLGPGGVFRGLRTVPALREVAEAMLEVCPDALLLNYANPMSVNCWATDLTGVRVVGLCHSVQGTSELLARELGVPLDEVTFECAGVNHTAWFTTFRRGDEDLLPRIREVMRARHVDGTLPLLPRSDDAYESVERVRTELMLLTGLLPHRVEPPRQRVLGVVPPHARAGATSTWTGTGTTWRSAARRTRPAATGRLLEEARREGIRHGGEFAALIVDSIVTGTPRVVYGNVRNGGLRGEPAGRRLRRGCVPGRRRAASGRSGTGRCRRRARRSTTSRSRFSD